MVDKKSKHRRKHNKKASNKVMSSTQLSDTNREASFAKNDHPPVTFVMTRAREKAKSVTGVENKVPLTGVGPKGKKNKQQQRQLGEGKKVTGDEKEGGHNDGGVHNDGAVKRKDAFTTPEVRLFSKAVKDNKDSTPLHTTKPHTVKVGAQNESAPGASPGKGQLNPSTLTRENGLSNPELTCPRENTSSGYTELSNRAAGSDEGTNTLSLSGLEVFMGDMNRSSTASTHQNRAVNTDSIDTGPDIIHALEKVHAKLESLEEMNSGLKTDLQRCEGKWESGMADLAGRLTKVEKQWVSCRQFIQKELATVQTSLDSNSSKVLELQETVDAYKEKWDSLPALEQKIKDAAEDKFQQLKGTIKEELKNELIQEMSENIKANNKEVKQDMNFELMKEKAFNKRHNIVMFGLPDNEFPEDDLRDVVNFFKKRMNLRNLRIEDTYRLGLYGNINSDKPRPLVITFSNIKDRWAVWNRRRRIKYVESTPIWLHEDLPKQLRSEFRVLQRIAKVANMNPEKFGEARVKEYKLHLNGQIYGTEQLHLLPQELSPHAVYSPRSEEALVFFTRNSPFSNHFPCNFQLEGRSFVGVEQYLAVHRAYLSRNRSLAREAMETKDPADHKVILNRLRKEHIEEWKEKAPQLILAASRAKYSQNQLLKNLLISTNQLRIGEASRDSFWGIGIPLENADALDTSKWAMHGNLLGETLMKVREELTKNTVVQK